MFIFQFFSAWVLSSPTRIEFHLVTMATMHFKEAAVETLGVMEIQDIWVKSSIFGKKFEGIRDIR